MTIKEKDFKSFAQVRPEVVELADRLVDLLPIREDEHFAFVRVGLIYRNQAFRECLLTGRRVTLRTSKAGYQVKTTTIPTLRTNCLAARHTR